MHEEAAKRAAGRAAAEYIEPDMIVGLGTGSTVVHFIDRLIERCRDGLRIQAVASSRGTAERAQRGGLTLLDIDSVSTIDLTVDGADEIDPQKRMIKGGGGAHVREKILASSSTELVVIVDETKCVPLLGTAKLPVEIVSYGAEQTRRKLERAGYHGEWRRSAGALFLSDNGHPILDLQFETPLRAPEREHERIMQVPGVIDTGFFFHLAGRVIVGHPNGHVDVKT